MGKVAVTDHRTKPPKGWQQAAERMLAAHSGQPAAGYRTEISDDRKIAITRAA